MPGATEDNIKGEEIEPQSLKKLWSKSLKRSLDLFSPLHGQIPPPDPASKQVRTSHKFNVEYGGIKSTGSQPPANSRVNAQGPPSQSSSSNTLALSGPGSSNDLQNGGAQTALVVGPALQQTGTDAGPGRRTAIIPGPGSSERNFSTSAIMERIPARWPRPEWHAPWKNYRVISGHLGWVRSIAFDPSNSWFCTGSADRTIKT